MGDRSLSHTAASTRRRPRALLPAFLLLLLVSAGMAACDEAAGPAAQNEALPGKIVDQVEPVQLQGSCCSPLIGQVALSPEAAAYVPPAQVTVYRIVPAGPVTQESMDAVADQFGFGPAREYGVDWLRGSGGLLKFPRADDAACYALSGGGGQPPMFRELTPEEVAAMESGVPQEPPPAPTPEETRAIADAFLERWGLSGDLTFVGASESGAYGTASLSGESQRWVTEMRAHYQAYVDGIPLDGAGSQVSARVDLDRNVIEFTHFVEEAVESEHAVTIRPVEAALADLKAGVSEGPSDLSSEQVTSITVEGIEIYYYAAPARWAEMYYKPVYVFHVRLSDGTLRDWTLSAFEGRTGGGSSPTAPPNSVRVQQYFTVEWEETVTILNGVRMVAHSPQVDPKATPRTPGNVVVYCVVEMTNGLDVPIAFDKADLTLSARNESWPGGYGGLAVVSDQPLSAGTLQPGETVRGAVPFEFSPAEAEAAMTLHYYRFHGLVPTPVTVSVEWHGGP